MPPRPPPTSPARTDQALELWATCQLETPSLSGARLNTYRLLLALLCSPACFQGTESTGKLRPTISSPLLFSPSFGQKFSIPCEGHSAFPRNCIIYWLANGTFVDELYPGGAVSQAGTREKAKGAGLLLRRELTFRAFSGKDLHTRFECIVLDPAGPVRKAVTWRMKGSTENTKAAPEPSCAEPGEGWDATRSSGSQATKEPPRLAASSTSVRTTLSPP